MSLISDVKPVFLKLAYRQARQSNDRSTQNGAVLVDDRHSMLVAAGHNDIPEMCCDTPERRQRPEKYAWTEHAERAAIFAAARRGVKTDGLTMYVAWAACADCGRAIVLAGIKKVVRHKIPQHAERPDWAASIAAADQMFREAGVEVVEYVGELGETFRFNGVDIAV
jgi:dCMP deaminase